MIVAVATQFSLPRFEANASRGFFAELIAMFNGVWVGALVGFLPAVGRYLGPSAVWQMKKRLSTETQSLIVGTGRALSTSVLSSITILVLDQ